MGKIVALDGPALAWARGQFARYYATASVDPPSRFARREFAAFPFATETLMRRHAAFPSAGEIHEFLSREVPRHVYYSSAYYQFPDHPKMAGKEWLGADLIFDLDADHLRQAEGRDFAGQLALVKEKVAALLDDFLFGDFGIDPAQTSLVFSGGRGYHVHVHEDAYLTLTSPERREIVEYVTGLGVDPAMAVLEHRERDRPALAMDEGGSEDSGVGRSSRPRTRGYKHLAPPDSPGWTGRTTRAVLQLLQRWDAQGKDAAAEEIEGFGVPRARARSLARLLVEERRGQQIRDGLTLDVFPREVPRELLEVVLKQAAIEVQGETDAPVTTDIHRLIRLPNSLHGGTGFRVTPLTRESLDRFDPMRDAPVPAEHDDTTRVELTEAVHYPFASTRIDAVSGETKVLPTPLALFLVLRGEATLRP